ncbi:MAG TPA: sugar transferase [Chitinophagaceae bacterium]|nr:sugar transferase [Chitinophagaceae bacterium]
MNSEQIKKSLPRYRFIKVGDQAPTQDELENNVFYIGDNTNTLQNISDTLQVGYSSAISFQQAVSYLKELHRENINFNAVFIDLPYDKAGLRQFHRYFTNSSFATLPLIYLSTNLSDQDRDELTNICLVDDIIHPTRDIFTIRERISFLTRIKASLSKGRGSVTVEHDFSLYDGTGSVVKRVFDIVISSMAILVISPLFLLIALLIKLDSSGPIFYNSYRAGRGYRIFKFYKFRTMKVGADRMVTSLSHMNQYHGKDAPVFFKVNNDPRVTGIGAFLRNTSLDELPQLFNVLKGDMSLVGNRPLPLYEASSLTTNEWAERFVAPAGITGLWQVRKRGQADMSVEDRINLDIDYAKKCNMMMDFKIILQTPRVLIQDSNV